MLRRAGQSEYNDCHSLHPSDHPTGPVLAQLDPSIWPRQPFPYSTPDALSSDAWWSSVSSRVFIPWDSNREEEPSVQLKCGMPLGRSGGECATPQTDRTGFGEVFPDLPFCITPHISLQVPVPAQALF